MAQAPAQELVHLAQDSPDLGPHRGELSLSGTSSDPNTAFEVGVQRDPAGDRERVPLMPNLVGRADASTHLHMLN